MKDRFEVLDVFRGLFAAMVVFFHMSAFAHTPLLNNPLVDNSDLFVDFFFVLSGFVIAYNYREVTGTGKLKQFLGRRWLRIYPLHLVMLLAFVVVEAGKLVLAGHIQINNPANPNNNWTSFATSLLLLNSIKVPGVQDVSWNIPSWSISAEMISYVFFGCLLLLLHHVKGSRYKTLLSIGIVAGAVGVVALATGSGALNYSYNLGWLRGLAGFFTGVLCQQAFTALRSRLQALPATFFHLAEGLLLTGIVCMVWAGAAIKPFGFVYLVLFFFSVMVFAFERGFASQLLKRSGILQRMGRYSYAIYMTHALLLSLFNIVFIRLLHLPPSAYSWLFALNFLCIYKVAEYTHKHVEMRFFKSKKASPTAARKQEKQYGGEVLTAAL